MIRRPTLLSADAPTPDKYDKPEMTGYWYTLHTVDGRKVSGPYVDYGSLWATVSEGPGLYPEVKVAMDKIVVIEVHETFVDEDGDRCIWKGDQ